MNLNADPSLLDVDFSQLLLGFASAALHYCGESVTEEQDSPEPNQDLAMQNIKIIELLRIKTTGNLDQEEKTLIDSILSDLNQKFSQTFGTK